MFNSFSFSHWLLSNCKLVVNCTQHTLPQFRSSSHTYPRSKFQFQFAHLNAKPSNVYVLVCSAHRPPPPLQCGAKAALISCMFKCLNHLEIAPGSYYHHYSHTATPRRALIYLQYKFVGFFALRFFSFFWKMRIINSCEDFVSFFFAFGWVHFE